MLRKEIFATRTYSATEKEAMYKAMLMKMKLATAKRRNIVLDGIFHSNMSGRCLLTTCSIKPVVNLAETAEAQV